MCLFLFTAGVRSVNIVVPPLFIPLSIHPFGIFTVLVYLESLIDVFYQLQQEICNVTDEFVESSKQSVC